MILLYLLCGFTIIACGVFGWYWHQVSLPTISVQPQPQKRIVYEVHACKEGSNTLLIPFNEWSESPSTLVINGCIYTISTIERLAEFVKLTLDRNYLYVWGCGEGLQHVGVNKWFKLHLLNL